MKWLEERCPLWCRKLGGEELDGKSFLPVLLGEKNQHHSEIYASNTWNVLLSYSIRALRTETHKYIRNIDSQFIFPTPWSIDAPAPQFQIRLPVWRSWEEKAKTDPFAAERVQVELFRPPEELYDIRNDPHELNNLAEDPSQKEVLASLREKLKAWMRQQGDAGDSAYHKDVSTGKNFLDEIYGRQKVVNVKMIPLGASGGTSDTVEVHLTCPVWRTEIHYTPDGSEPTRNATRYTEPFKVDPTMTIKAKGYWEGGETPVKVVEFTGVDFRFLYQGHYKPISW